MLLRRRSLCVLLAATVVAFGCGSPYSSPNTPPPLSDRIDAALRRAGGFLVKQQSPDGAWRSTVYGSMKDGPSLTPLVLESLYSLPDTETIKTARKKGVDYLVAMVKDDGTIDPGPAGWSFAVYSAAKSVVVLSREEAAHRKARDAWLKFLRGHQLTESLGWQPGDPFYGGWGYADEPPSKPPKGQRLNSKAEPNISATVYALDALRAAGVGSDDPAVKKALAFVQRCQNFSDNGDPQIDDGGFFFLQVDGDRNKAGFVEKGNKTKTRQFRSYGSTTADGIRCLLHCGLSPDHPRVRAAVSWLTDHFRPDQHPGEFPKSQENARDSLYYYYCDSAATALRLTDARIPGTRTWHQALAVELLRRDKFDGFWRNPVGATREDDPLVATAFAVEALSRCRAAVRKAGTP